MSEHIFDSLPSKYTIETEDRTEKVLLASNAMLVGIILPNTRILRTQYSPQVEIEQLSEVKHDPIRLILIVTGQTDKAMVCQYFRCIEVETVPLNFSAS